MRWSCEHGMIVRRVGDGPAMVWIHGLGEQSASFAEIAGALPGFTHVLPDLPGYGRSPPRPLPAPGTDSLVDLADHLAAWLAATESAPALVVGHSLGGVLATLVAEQTRVRGVIDVDGNLTRGDCTFSLQAAAYTADELAAQGFARIRDGVYAAGATDRALRGYHAAMCMADPATFHRHAVDLIAASETETLAHRLVALAAPHLFVAGVPGGICERSRAELDRHGAHWIAISPSGHWPFVDQPVAFAAAVTSFAREIR